jgi:hypothetical protein
MGVAEIQQLQQPVMQGLRLRRRRQRGRPPHTRGRPRAAAPPRAIEQAQAGGMPGRLGGGLQLVQQQALDVVQHPGVEPGGAVRADEIAQPVGHAGRRRHEARTLRRPGEDRGPPLAVDSICAPCVVRCAG